MKNFLLVGFSPLIIQFLEEIEGLNLYVLEEKSLYEANHHAENEINNSKILKRVVFGEYMNSTKYEEVIDELDKEVHLDGVMPTRDYAVRAASHIAERLGLRGIGAENSKILTNKLLLRDACEKHNIPHPRFSRINSKEELKNFFNGNPIIFKPANRQASLGISKISSVDDIDKAWEYTINADEDEKQIVKRDFSAEYIAEEFVGGYEVSVETIVQDGEVIFNNITKKMSLDDSFVEIGHIVPAPLENEVQENIRREKTNFVKKLNIKNGLLHSEWKIVEGNPILIECAGRTPGDGIPRLISKAYDFNFFADVCRVYIGEKIKIPNEAVKVATSRFFIGKEGIVKKISGVDILKNNKHGNIIKYMINVKEGDKVKRAESSWDRLGLVFLYANTYEEMEKYCKEIADTVQFTIE